MGLEQRWLRIMLVAGVVATAVVVLPWAGIVVLAAWFAHLARPVLEASQRVLGGRRRAAALVTVLGMIVLLTPLAVVLVVSVATALDLLHRVEHTELGLQFVDMVGRSAKDGAVRAAQAVGRGATRVVIGFGLFVIGAYTCLVDGDRAWTWLGDRVPLGPAARARLAAAFYETGQGLLVGLMLTALTQALVATLVYAALGVPHAVVLGGLTFLAAFVPFIGTATVWVPVAVGLFVSGRQAAAVALVALGVLLIGAVDNLLRPYFARWGRLSLPTWLVALSMFGGFALLGFQGLVLGPVVMRVTLEVLAIVRAGDEEELAQERASLARAELGGEASPPSPFVEDTASSADEAASGLESTVTRPVTRPLARAVTQSRKTTRASAPPARGRGAS